VQIEEYIYLEERAYEEHQKEKEKLRRLH